MTSPIDPEMCLNTGRLLTEWFEYPHMTDEDIERQACEKFGTTLEDRPKGYFRILSDEDNLLQRRIQNFVTTRKNRKWKQGMTQQEVAHRMNEATKMVDPTNYKFLPDDVRDRTGLEINPLWMMEALVRSGLLSPKEQVAALKELAGYTHSKAPSFSHSTTTHMNPEDWLLELAKDEYKEITIEQPKQPVENGMGPEYEIRRQKKQKAVGALADFAAAEFEKMAETIDADWEDFPPNG